MISYIEYEVRVYGDGTRHWLSNNKLHREDGPADERADGSKLWYINGKLHRSDGPAIEYSNGNKSWYLNNQRVSEQVVMSTSLVGKTVTIDGIQYLLGDIVK